MDDQADFFHLTFLLEKNVSYPIIFVGPFENGFLLVACQGYSSIGEGERNKNGTSHKFSCLNDCLNMSLNFRLAQHMDAK